MTFTHCRGCGVSLADSEKCEGAIAFDDGLCGPQAGCAIRFAGFARSNGVEVDEAYAIDFARPEVQVVFDQWLDSLGTRGAAAVTP